MATNFDGAALSLSFLGVPACRTGELMVWFLLYIRYGLTPWWFEQAAKSPTCVLDAQDFLLEKQYTACQGRAMQKCPRQQAQLQKTPRQWPRLLDRKERDGQRLVLRCIEYGCPSNQWRKITYTKIIKNTDTTPSIFLQGNGQDMQAGPQLPATILVMTLYWLKPNKKLLKKNFPFQAQLAYRHLRTMKVGSEGVGKLKKLFEVFNWCFEDLLWKWWW